MALLAQVAIYLTAAVVVVPLARRAGLGSVLGYLLAGVIVGPWALDLVLDEQEILHFAEFGVVLLLFVIGLELQPRRLWAMRRAVFGLGGGQFALTAVVLACLGMVLGLSLETAAVAGLAPPRRPHRTPRTPAWSRRARPRAPWRRGPPASGRPRTRPPSPSRGRAPGSSFAGPRAGPASGRRRARNRRLQPAAGPTAASPTGGRNGPEPEQGKARVSGAVRPWWRALGSGVGAALSAAGRGGRTSRTHDATRRGAWRRSSPGRSRPRRPTGRARGSPRRTRRRSRTPSWSRRPRFLSVLVDECVGDGVNEFRVRRHVMLPTGKNRSGPSRRLSPSPCRSALHPLGSTPDGGTRTTTEESGATRKYRSRRPRTARDES